MRRPPVAVLAAAIAALVLVAATVQSTTATSAGFVAKVGNTASKAGSTQAFTCAQAIVQDASSAYFGYALNEPSASTAAVDLSGHLATGSYRNAMTTTTVTPKPCPRDGGGSYVLNGANAFVIDPVQVAAPSTFTLEVWFQSTALSGRLIGFGNSNSTLVPSLTYDRALYISTTGQLTFGIDAGHTVTTPLSYADGAWHNVIVTVSSATGQRIYVDGVNVATGAYSTPFAYQGWWRIGFDLLALWPNSGVNHSVTGNMRFVSAYSTVLSADRIAAHYRAGRP